jgi:hypothetical protein
MNVTPYQIIVPLAAFVAVAYAWNLVVRHKKTVWEACLWTVFWGGIAAIALEPSFLDYLSRLTGIQRRENAAVVSSIGILFFIVFSLVIRLEELGQRLTRLTRQIALRDAGLSEEKKDSVTTKQPE